LVSHDSYVFHRLEGRENGRDDQKWDESSRRRGRMFEGWYTSTVPTEHPHYPTENRFAPAELRVGAGDQRSGRLIT